MVWWFKTITPERQNGNEENIENHENNETNQNDNAVSPAAIEIGRDQGENAQSGSMFPIRTSHGNRKRFIILDGHSVALSGSIFSSKRLKICLEYFIKMGHNVLAVVSHSFSQATSDPLIFAELKRRQLISFAREDNGAQQLDGSAQEFLIFMIADTEDGVIISNSKFDDIKKFHTKRYPKWTEIMENRVLDFAWKGNKLKLPKQPHPKDGRSLMEFLMY